MLWRSSMSMKRKLSSRKLLDLVVEGEEILITRNGAAVAELFLRASEAWCWGGAARRQHQS